MFKFPSDSEASKKRLALAVEAEKAKRLPKSTRGNEALQQYIAQRHTTPQQQCAAQKQDGAQIAQVPDTARSGESSALTTPDAAAPDLKPGDLVMVRTIYTDGKYVPANFIEKEVGRFIRIKQRGATYESTACDWRLPTPEERAQFAPKDDGWISWSGVECPVHPGVEVEVRFGSGVTGKDRAGNWDWVHRKMLGDITAYRVLP